MAAMITELDTTSDVKFVEITTGTKRMTVSYSGQHLMTRFAAGKARLGLGKSFFGPTAIREALDAYKSADAKEMLLVAKSALGL